MARPWARWPWNRASPWHASMERESATAITSCRLRFRQCGGSSWATSRGEEPASGKGQRGAAPPQGGHGSGLGPGPRSAGARWVSPRSVRRASLVASRPFATLMSERDSIALASRSPRAQTDASANSSRKPNRILGGRLVFWNDLGDCDRKSGNRTYNTRSLVPSFDPSLSPKTKDACTR